MLEVPLNLSPLSIHKGLGVTQAMMEECFKLIPRNWDKVICVSLLLVLLPAKTDLISEEIHGKSNLGRPRSSSDSKIVLTLLTEFVAVYIGLFVVYVQRTGFQLISSRLGDDVSWDGNRSGSGSGSRSGSGSGSRSGNGSGSGSLSL